MRRDQEFDLVPAGSKGLNLVDPEIMLTFEHLTQADHVVYEPTNVIRKRPGYSRFIAGVVTGAKPVRSGHDFWYRGAGGTLIQRSLCSSNGKVWRMASGVATSITPAGVTLDTDTIFTFCSLNSILLIFNNQDTAPWYWDGAAATATVLTGTGVRNWKAAVRHKGRLWAFGAPDYGDDVSYCADSDPLTWTGADAGYLPIDTGDGDDIVACSGSLYDRILVFKGPNIGSVHQISGNITDDFVVTPLGIEGVRVAGPRCVISVGSTIFVFSDRGLHDFSMTMKAGEVEHTFVSYGIHPLVKRVNFAKRERFSMVFVPSENAICVNVAVGQAADATSDVDTILVFNVRNQGWSVWPNVDVRSLWLARNSSTFVQELIAGSKAGYINKWFQVARSDNGSGIGLVIKTPRFALPEFKNLTNEVLFLDFYIFCMPTGAIPLTISYQVDNEDAASFILTGPAVGDAATLGIDFMLGDGGSRLGGPEATGGFITLHKHWAQAPKGRTIQFTISNAGNNQDVAIYGYALQARAIGEDKGRTS